MNAPPPTPEQTLEDDEDDDEEEEEEEKGYSREKEREREREREREGKKTERYVGKGIPFSAAQKARNIYVDFKSKKCRNEQKKRPN